MEEKPPEITALEELTLQDHLESGYLPILHVYQFVNATAPAKPEPPADPLTMNAAEVAREFRVHPDTVRRWARLGVLSGKQIGGRENRYLRADVMRHLASLPDSTERPPRKPHKKKEKQ